MAQAGEGAYVCTLSPELVEKARAELNEKPEWRNRDIQALRDMIKANPALKSRVDDEFLLRFLRAKKFDYDRAYQQLLNYYKIRAQHSSIIKDLKPTAHRVVIESGIFCVLPYRDNEGRKILYFRPGKWDPDWFTLYDILRVELMTLEKLIEEEETQINGLILISDFAKFGWAQAKKFESSYAKLMINIVQESFPARFKAMHAVNEPIVFGYIFALIKPFIKEKLALRLNFHGSDLEKLHEHISPDILPEELGGNLGPAETFVKEWASHLLQCDEYFADMQRYRIDLPPEDTTNNSKPADNLINCVVGKYKQLNNSA